MRVPFAIILIVASFPATASDYTGLGTFLVGLPTFIVLNSVFGIFLALPESKVRKVIASVLFAPAALLALLISNDAVAVIERGASWDWIIGVVYFALVGLSVFLYYKLVIKQPIQAPGGR